MKKRCIFLLAFFLLFASCTQVQGVGQSLSSTVKRIQSAISSVGDFIMADEEFIADHIGAPSYLEESALCFGAEGKAREFGVFRLSDRSKASEFKQSLRSYLQAEKEALSTLAELYPAEELAERLALYENATVGSEGMLVYYFVLDKKETDKALQALTGR